MLSAGGLELTSFIDSDFPKGCRSAIKRTKKAAQRSLKRGSGQLVFVDSEGFDMSTPESEKNQETSLGRRSCDKIEHLPIKKRRFSSSSPVPPSRIQCADQGEAAIARSEDVSVEREVNIQCKDSMKEVEQADNELFCGISLLAAAACSSSLKKHFDRAEDASAAEVPQPQGVAIENSENNEAGSLSNRLKEEHLNYSKRPVEATPSGISGESVVNLIPVSVSEKAQVVGSGDSYTFPGAGEDCLKAAQDVSWSQDEDKLSCRDDRLCWDLNVTMDAWGQPFDDPAHYTNVADDVHHEAVETKCDEEFRIAKAHDLPSELENVVSEEHVMLMSCEPVHCNQCSDSNSGDQKVDVGSRVEQRVSVSENSVSDECKDKVDPSEVVIECKSGDRSEANDLPGEPEKAGSEYQVMLMSCEPVSSNQCSDSNMEDQKVDVGSRVQHCEGVSENFVSDECMDKVDPLEDIIECKSADRQEPNELSAPVNKGVCSLMLDFLKKNVADVSSVSEVQEGVPSLSSDIAAVEVAQNLYNDDNATRDLQSDDNVIVEEIDMGMMEDFGVGLDTVREKVACLDDSVCQVAHVDCRKVETCQEMQVNEISVLKEDVMNTSVARDIGLDKNSVPSDGGIFCLTSAQKETSNVLSTGCRLMLALATGNDVSVDNNMETDAEAQSNAIVAASNQASMRDTSISVFNSVCGTNSNKTIIPCDGIALQEPVRNKDGSYTSCNLSLEGRGSQYEDGELGELAEHARKEYDGLNHEHKHVDIGSYNQELYSVGIADHHGVGIADHHGVETGQAKDVKECQRNAADLIPAACYKTKEELVIQHGSLTVYHRDLDEKGNLSKLNPSADEKMGASGLDELHDSNKSSSDATSRARDEGDKNDRISNSVDEFVDSETVKVRVDLQTSSKGKGTQLRATGPVDDVSFREGRHDSVGGRFRFGDGIIRRYDREPSSLRSSERFRYPPDSLPRGRKFDSWEGSAENRGIKRHYTPCYRGYCAADMGEDDGDVDFRVASKLDRELDPDVAGGKARFIRYNEVDNRAFRGKFNGPPPKDSFPSSLKFRHPWSQRERSPSPIGRRAYALAHQSLESETSSSRPRAHSPNARQSPRGRFRGGNVANAYFRQRSGSPNFRSEGRMVRMRSGHHQPGYVDDHMVRHRSFSRRKDSPPYAPSYLGQRDKESSHSMELGYKQRPRAFDRSPGRNRLRDDIVYGSPSIKTNGYRRSTQRDKFFEMDGPGRGIEYEENYIDRREHNAPIHLARHRYVEDAGRRLYHDDGDDCFAPVSREADDFPGGIRRGVDARIGDIARNFREEQQQFGSNTNPFGDDGVESSRNLKSNDHYKSARRARFVEVDNRGGGLGYED